MKFFKKVKKIFSDKNKVRFELENFYLLLRCYKQIELQKSFLYNREKDINKPSILLIVSSLGYTGGTESRLKKIY